MSKKAILIVVGIILLPFLIWYFGFKKSDYTIHFKAKAATGTVYSGVLDWFETYKKTDTLTYKIVNHTLYTDLEVELSKAGKTYLYAYDIEPVNDSVSDITVSISEKGKGFYNKLTAPFFPTEFKNKQIQLITNFKDGLVDHLSKLKVKVTGNLTSKPVFVAYINLNSIQEEKAQTMIMNDHFVTSYLAHNKIKIIGTPYLEVLDWDPETKKLNFNYCFPIDKNTKYIPDTKVKFKTIVSVKGLGATYYGNYRTSDRAWYSILDFAKKNKIKTQYKVLEHFFANPFNGGNELDWKTEIIIPTDK
jgi:effector-binding domain-containing protein